MVETKFVKGEAIRSEFGWVRHKKGVEGVELVLSDLNKGRPSNLQVTVDSFSPKEWYPVETQHAILTSITERFGEGDPKVVRQVGAYGVRKIAHFGVILRFMKVRTVAKKMADNMMMIYRTIELDVRGGPCQLRGSYGGDVRGVDNSVTILHGEGSVSTLHYDVLVAYNLQNPVAVLVPDLFRAIHLSLILRMLRSGALNGCSGRGRQEAHHNRIVSVSVKEIDHDVVVYLRIHIVAVGGVDLGVEDRHAAHNSEEVA